MKQGWSILVFVLCLLLTACNTTRKVTMDDAYEVVSLSSEEQRRYEYYYLEAIRLEQQGRYDEAFEMLNHCLAISPTAPSALYKMANYYFFLNRNYFWNRRKNICVMSDIFSHHTITAGLRSNKAAAAIGKGAS